MKELTEKQLEQRKRIMKTVTHERLEMELSQEQLAELAGMQRSNLSRLESGNQNVSVDQLIRVAEAMGKDIKMVMEDAVPYGEQTAYDIKLFDESLIKISIERTQFGIACRILDANEKRRDVFPLDLELTDEGLYKWLNRRSIPKNREYVAEMMHSLGLVQGDYKGVIDICKGLSLNDSYWVVPSDFGGSYSQFNLYENHFSEVLSLIAFTGYSRRIDRLLTSPEFTTGGMLRKGWRFFGKNDIWLYKGGSEGFANSGNEPYSEVYAYQVAKKMGLNAIEYSLVRWKGILASKCRLFTDINTSFVPIGRIVKTGGIEAVIDYYKSWGDDAYQELASMLVFDAVIYNEDRHFGNFGVLRDSRTGKIISPAPIFDNGVSLLCYAMKPDFENIDGYALTRSNPYGIKNNYENLCRTVIGPRQRAQLRRLVNFRFESGDVSDLPQWRLAALEDLIQKRVRKLLEL